MFESKISEQNVAWQNNDPQAECNESNPKPPQSIFNKTFGQKRKKGLDNYMQKKHSHSGQFKNRFTIRNKVERMNTEFNLKTMVNLFLKQSSIHSFNQIGNSTTTARKIFWMIILVVGIVGCVAQVSQLLFAYLKYPVVTNRNSISANYQKFPAVTICNMNPIRKQFLPCLEDTVNNEECISTNRENVSEVFLSNKTSEPICSESIFTNTPVMQAIWEAKLMRQSEASKVEYGHQRREFIRSCTFNLARCDYNNFVPSLSNVYGNCFTFNAVGTRNSSCVNDFGPNTGLEVDLDLEVNQYVSLTDSIGARVQIHDPYLDHNIDKEGINLRPGLKTCIALSRYDSERLPTPYKDHCRKYNVNDSKKDCTTRCEHRFTAAACSCSFSLVTELGVQKCDRTKASGICCMLKLRRFDRRTCNCPLPCKETFYDTRISHTEWPARSYFEANPLDFMNRINGTFKYNPFEEVRKTRLKLKVFFDTLEYIVHKQNPMYQSSEILSNIGGQFGLWLGLSLVAIFESVVSFADLCKFRLRG